MGRASDDSMTFFALIAGSPPNRNEMSKLRAGLESHGLRCQGWVHWDSSHANDIVQPSTAHSVVVMFGPDRGGEMQNAQVDAELLEVCLQNLLENCLKERRRIIPIVFPGGSIPRGSIFTVLNPLVVSFHPVDREAPDRLARIIRQSFNAMATQMSSTHQTGDVQSQPVGMHSTHGAISKELIAAAAGSMLSVVFVATGNPIMTALAVITGLAAFASLISAARSAFEVDSGRWWARVLTFIAESLANEPDRVAIRG